MGSFPKNREDLHHDVEGTGIDETTAVSASISLRHLGALKHPCSWNKKDSRVVVWRIRRDLPGLQRSFVFVESWERSDIALLQPSFSTARQEE